MRQNPFRDTNFLPMEGVQSQNQNQRPEGLNIQVLKWQHKKGRSSNDLNTSGSCCAKLRRSLTVIGVPFLLLVSDAIIFLCLRLLRCASNWILPFKMTLHCWQLNVWRLASKEWAVVVQGRGWWSNTLVQTTFRHGIRELNTYVLNTEI